MTFWKIRGSVENSNWSGIAEETEMHMNHKFIISASESNYANDLDLYFFFNFQYNFLLILSYKDKIQILVL